MHLVDLIDQLVKVVGLAAVVAGGITGWIKYAEQRERDRQLRRDELEWRKTQFVFQLAETFESSARFLSALQMLVFDTGVPAGSSLKQILDTEKERLTRKEKEVRLQIDGFLDFFDRLEYYTFDRHAFDPKDLRCFAWYVALVEDNPVLRGYVEQAPGRHSLLKLGEAMRRAFPQAYPWVISIPDRRRAKRPGRREV